MLDQPTASNTAFVSAAAAPDEVTTAVATIKVTAPVPNAIISTAWNLVDQKLRGDDEQEVSTSSAEFRSKVSELAVLVLNEKGDSAP